MEGKRGEGFSIERGDKRFDHEADDRAEAEGVVFVEPFIFEHGSEVGGHAGRFRPIVAMAGDGEFYAAAEGFDEVAGQAGAGAAEFVDDADAGVETGSEALPFDGMVEEAIAVIESGVERVGGFAFFAGEEVLSYPESVR